MHEVNEIAAVVYPNIQVARPFVRRGNLLWAAATGQYISRDGR